MIYSTIKWGSNNKLHLTLTEAVSMLLLIIILIHVSIVIMNLATKGFVHLLLTSD